MASVQQWVWTPEAKLRSVVVEVRRPPVLGICISISCGRDKGGSTRFPSLELNWAK